MNNFIREAVAAVLMFALILGLLFWLSGRV